MKLQIILVLALSITFVSCWDMTESNYNNVNIRLENLTGKDLSNLTIGRRVYRNGGLDFVDYKHRFEILRNNQITNFYDTQGKFMGYKNVRGHIDGKPVSWYSEEKDKLFLSKGAYEDSWESPFTGNIWDGFSLEQGRYTYQLTLNEDERFFIIDIIEE